MSSGGDRAPSQGGVIEGLNPSKYNPKDPIIIFIIQASFILIFCHALHWPLSKIRQPRVIAEVIGGILLGPSVMGKIPGFRDAIFPAESIPNLALVANLGLVLYLFLIGLETDVRFLVSNWRIASSVAFAGLALPFGLGCALAWGLYHEFRNDEGLIPIQFSTYMLFVGVAIAITAFPVLCRILTELNLLSTSAGIVTLSAGVANDVIGWILLALCVALANSGSGITALWILLACVGYLFFLLYLVKPALHWLLRRSGSLERGPSQSMIALIIFIALASAFFTGIIGVHAIFGGFMVGLILPRDNGFAIKVTEKLEDLIGALFLPLYFTLSGLNTDLGLLNSAITWGYVVAVTLTAFFSKIIGATIAARFSGLVWRESLTVGALMSCKGLVELIVLNIGLQANILSRRTFTIFVVMALLTTFATTPLVTFLYPPWYQKKLAAWKRGEIDWDTGEATSGTDAAVVKPLPRTRVDQLLVYLRLDNMPSLLNILALFGTTSSTEAASSSSEKSDNPGSEKQPAVSSNPNSKPVRAHGLRLLQLGDRDSSVMTVSEVEEYTRTDPVVNTFRTVGQIFKVAVSGEVATMPESRFAEALLTKSSDIASDLVLLPWSGGGTLGDLQAHGSESKLSASYISFVKSMLASKDHNLALVFPQAGTIQAMSNERVKLTRAYSFSDIHHDISPLPVKDQAHRIILPYFGGNDDRFALMLLLQLCENADVTAVVVQISTTGSSHEDSDYIASVSTHLSSDVSSRLEFKTVSTSDAAGAIVSSAKAAVREDTRETTYHNVVMLGRRAGIGGGSSPTSKVVEDIAESLGDSAATLIASRINADLLVVQGKTSGL